MGKLQAIIFDMDGVISDTQTMHARFESLILKEYGIDIPPDEISERFAGVSTREFMGELLKEKIEPGEIGVILERKWIMMKQNAESGVKEITGAKDLVTCLFEIYPLALASASRLDYVKAVLTVLGILKYFKAIVSADEVLKGKPDPAVFLLAADRLKVLPKKCLVVEDSLSGMQAAKSAGMYCVGLVKNKNRSYPADYLIDNPGELKTIIADLF